MTEALQHKWLSHFAESPLSGPRSGEVEWNIAAFDDDGPYVEEGGDLVQACTTVAGAAPVQPQTASHEEVCYQPLQDLRLTTSNGADCNNASCPAPPSPPLTDITNDDSMASEGNPSGDARSGQNKRRAVAPSNASSASLTSFGPAEGDGLNHSSSEALDDTRRPRKSMRMV